MSKTLGSSDRLQPSLVRSEISRVQGIPVDDTVVDERLDLIIVANAGDDGVGGPPLRRYRKGDDDYAPLTALYQIPLY